MRQSEIGIYAFMAKQINKQKSKHSKSIPINGFLRAFCYLTNETLESDV